MLEITICTKDNFLRKQFENVVTQLMNTNQIEFHLTEVKSSEEIKDNSFLILGDSDALASYHQKRMMIVVLNDHHQDKALANLALTCFIKKEDVETHLYETVSQWLDYYFENYHYNFDDVHDFFVNEIMYFKVKSFSELTAVSEDRCIDFTVKNGYEILLNSLPMNFLMVGTEYIINVDMITSIENGTATMKDGAVIDNVDENKIKDRSQRFELGVSETVAIGDKYDAKKIKKANKESFIFSFVLTIFFFAILVRSVELSLPIAFVVCVPVFVLFQYVMYLNAVGASGNYYELREDGIHYYDSDKIKDRYQWSKAIEKGEEEKMLSFVPYQEVVEVRIGTRAGANLGVMYAGMKNYNLKLKIQTMTNSLSFEENFDFTSIFKLSKRHDDIAHLLNRLTLHGTHIEGDKQILMAFNDPNASLRQYMTKKNSGN